MRVAGCLRAPRGLAGEQASAPLGRARGQGLPCQRPAPPAAQNLGGTPALSTPQSETRARCAMILAKVEGESTGEGFQAPCPEPPRMHSAACLLLLFAARVVDAVSCVLPRRAASCVSASCVLSVHVQPDAHSSNPPSHTRACDAVRASAHGLPARPPSNLRGRPWLKPLPVPSPPPHLFQNGRHPVGTRGRAARRCPAPDSRLLWDACC